MNRLRVFAAVFTVVATAGCGIVKSNAVSTSTTATTPTTTITPAIQAARLKNLDRSAIRTMIEAQNTAYRTGLGTGFDAEAAADYYVLVGHDTGAACIASWQRQHVGLIDDIFHPDTVVATPNWIAPYVGKPKGRVYSFTVDETVSDPNGQLPPSTQTATVHATVMSDGIARGFDDCEALPHVSQPSVPPLTDATLPTFAPIGLPSVTTPRVTQPLATTTPLPVTTTTALPRPDVRYYGWEATHSGATNLVDVSYENSDGTTSEQTSTASVNLDAGRFMPGSFFDLTVSDETGDPDAVVVCQVDIDGRTFMKHHSTGSNSYVDCFGTVP